MTKTDLPMLDGLSPDYPFVLLEDSRGGTSWLLTDMADAVTAQTATEVLPALDAIRKAVAQGQYAAGWMGFEAGYAFEPRVSQHVTPGDLLWFGLFKNRRRLSALEVETIWRTAPATPQCASITSVTPRWSAEDYATKMAQVHDYILAGDIYQANLTFAADVKFEGSPLDLYRTCRTAQRVPYGALVFTGARWILSFSPELFFALEQGQLTVQPMKGTAARAWLPALDALAAETLQKDEKNRAENLMIVDLLRNDMSRVSVPGSVHVPSLFDIISYPTVHQMVSTIISTVTLEHDAIDVLQALFPCGSVTGAPKLRAMEIIKALETGPRQVYCGAIGQIAADGDASFNVAIRTLDICSPGKAVLGLGSGVVADSKANEEYQECLLKAKFLTQTIRPFDLIETLIWRPDTGWWALDAHLARLEKSAKYWDFTLDLPRLRHEAAQTSASWNFAVRARLLVSRFGASTWQWSAAPNYPGSDTTILISPQRMQSTNIFLYHKTSHRNFYDDERKKLQAQYGCFDCVFLNEREEVTEGSFTTVFVRKGKLLLTPALGCGLLPGILRQSLLDSGEAQEAILTLDDLRHADALILGNSVRGFVGVTLREF
jgi:para-aminobenzoate synthetase / 4-amino-4-deoxychorismate lyase